MVVVEYYDQRVWGKFGDDFKSQSLQHPENHRKNEQEKLKKNAREI